jgi:antitoxin VapB
MKKSPASQSPFGFKTARLFRNGANQAIRIPREFELPGTEVTIRQVAGTLVIEPVKASHAKGSTLALLQALASLEPLTEISDVFPNVDDGLLALKDLADKSAQ